MPVQSDRDTFATLQSLIGEVLHSASPAPSGATPLIDSGLDSLALAVLREQCEKAFGIVIPATEWSGADSIYRLAELIDRVRSTSSPGPPAWKPDDMAEPLEIGMPLLGIGHLCESALLKHLGDIRWRHLTRLTGVLSRDLADDQGKRLYPAFFYVELRFPEARPMGSFGENDTFIVMDTLQRYGLSILDGTSYLLPPGRRLSKPLTSLEDASEEHIPAVRMSNAFVMQFDGAEWLKRSHPRPGILDRVAELPAPPDSYALSKKAQEQGTLAPPPGDALPLHASEGAYLYQIQPDRDVNGVGLLYFANYPLFLDIAERAALKSLGHPWSDTMINSRSLVQRKIAFLNNANWHDSLEIHTRCWVRSAQSSQTGKTLLATEQTMHRKSDGRRMCVSWSEKLVSDGPGAGEFFRGL